MQEMLRFKLENDGQSARLEFGSDVHWYSGMGKTGPEVKLMVGCNALTAIGGSDFPFSSTMTLNRESVPTFALIRAQNFSDAMSFPWHRDFPSQERIIRPEC